jgi:hypothetical protein
MECGDVISRSYPVISFCISGIEPSVSVIRELVSDITQGGVFVGKKNGI